MCDGVSEICRKVSIMPNAKAIKLHLQLKIRNSRAAFFMKLLLFCTRRAEKSVQTVQLALAALQKGVRHEPFIFKSPYFRCKSIGNVV